MARIRTIKPEFFRHADLFDAEQETRMPLRVAFAGLWTVADRDGKFRWRPRDLKLDCLPHDDVDFSSVMDSLEKYGFVRRYQVDGEWYGLIPSWKTHQVINIREAKSTIPDAPDGLNDMHVHAHAKAVHVPNGVNIPDGLRQTVIARDGGKCVRCGCTEDLTVDHIFPQSLGGTHAITNLRCLCRSCNSARPVAGQALIDDLKKDGLTLNDMQSMCMHVQVRGERKGREGKGRGKEEELAAGFDAFWDAWPSHSRKTEKQKCLDHWKAEKLADVAEQIMQSLDSWKASAQWLKDGGQFIPAPIVWLRRKAFEAASPVPFAVLQPVNKQEAVEQRNQAALEQWLAQQGAGEVYEPQ